MDVSKVFSQNAKVVSSDEDIIRQVREGKSHFFEQIVERYSDKMFKYLYYYFNFNGALAEDVVQGLFIKLWENLDKYDPGQKFSTWLYRLAHNYTIDWLRKNEKEQQTYAFSQL
jgi:RNA polymerase sigma-70 factor (ECF subfamily)